MEIGQSAQELLIFDPRLYSGMEKYVWISDSAKAHGRAQCIFVNMLKMGIYIKGFATDKETMVGLKMFNKEIYDITALEQEKDIVFDDFYLWWCFDKIELPEKVHSMRMLNPDMDRENIIIWGSGVTGRHVYKMLSANGIKVECYVDSNRDLAGTYQCSLPVYTPEYLEKNVSNPIIIEAMEKWAELDEYIKERYEKRFYFSFVESDKQKESSKGRYIRNMLDLKSWNSNFVFFVGKRVYVYGIGEVECELAKCLKLLDIDFGGFLTDESDAEISRIQSNYNIKFVEEVLYEKNYFIWVYSGKRVKRLEELGLISHEDYIYYHGVNNTSLRKKYILDINLGHNYLSDSKYPGFMVYGNEKEQDLKIAVLGGSTTDGKIFSFKSWPELMYEELCSKGLKDVTVYNGGVSGYASGQELLKLIRDVTSLKPDMVIVYDGFNDLNMHFSYPLTNGYLETIFAFAKKNIENDEDDSLITDDFPVCRGIEAKKDMFDGWLSNIRMMYAIANEMNIRFYAFCQPVLSSKVGKTETEKNILLSIDSPAIVNLLEGSFRKRMEQVKQSGYIYDLSHIFDYEQGIYIDQCHVREKGNQIIAREIARIILPELYCK